MKTGFRIIILLGLSSFMFFGCGKNKNRNSAGPGYTCDVNGYCYNGGNAGGGFGFGNNPNAVMLGGNLTVVNQNSSYEQYLEDRGQCFNNSFGNTCGNVASGLSLSVQVDDYQFRSSEKSSTGYVSINSGFSDTAFQVVFRMIQQNSGFDTQIGGPVGVHRSNRRLIVQIFGRPTDSQVTARVYYRSLDSMVAEGVLNRINRTGTQNFNGFNNGFNNGFGPVGPFGPNTSFSNPYFRR